MPGPRIDAMAQLQSVPEGDESANGIPQFREGSESNGRRSAPKSHSAAAPAANGNGLAHEPEDPAISKGHPQDYSPAEYSHDRSASNGNAEAAFQPRDGEQAELHLTPGEMAIPPPPSHGFRPLTAMEARQQDAAKEQLMKLDQAVTTNEIIEYAEFLGMEPGVDSKYLWIAEQALCAPLPEGWEEMEDHRGNTFYVFTDDSGETQTSWEHPYDEFYRDVFFRLKGNQWDLSTLQEVVDMADYLNLDPKKHAPLMWIAHQATLAPVPDGWEQMEDETGAFFVNREQGLSSRAHPLDSVFRIAAMVERSRYEKGEASLARAAALSEGSGSASLQTRLLEDDGSGAYTYDWLAGLRVEEEPQVDGLQELRMKQLAARSAAERGDLTINTLRNGSDSMPQSPAVLDHGASPSGATLAGFEGSLPSTPLSSAITPSSPSMFGQRVTLVSRQSGVGRSSKVLERKGSLGHRSRLSQRQTRKWNPKAGMRPFEHYPKGLPDTKRPEGFDLLNPVAIWVWVLYYAWAWALVLPVVRRILPKPSDR